MLSWHLSLLASQSIFCAYSTNQDWLSFKWYEFIFVLKPTLQISECITFTAAVSERRISSHWKFKCSNDKTSQKFITYFSSLFRFSVISLTCQVDVDMHVSPDSYSNQSINESKIIWPDVLKFPPGVPEIWDTVTFTAVKKLPQGVPETWCLQEWDEGIKCSDKSEYKNNYGSFSIKPHELPLHSLGCH